MKMQSWLTVAMLVLTTGLAGCGQYVNIPQDPGDVAAHSPNLLNARQTAVAAVQAVLEDRPLGRPYRLVLPVGSSDATYAYAMGQLGADASWSDQAPPADIPVIDVRHIRIRSWLAQVDVIRPVDARQPGGMQQLMSVYLKFDWGRSWYVDRMHLWRIPLEDALFQARYSDIDAPPLNTAPPGEPVRSPAVTPTSSGSSMREVR